MSPPLPQRFERNVDRSGEHHLWTGTTRLDRGTGRLKVRGRDTSAHRVAWELVHGVLPPEVRVIACPSEPRCVRLEHLSLDRDVDDRPTENDSGYRRRGRRGAGSKRSVVRESGS